METLPPEMVEKITQYLTLQDLVRCCTVCRDWRNIFNEDHYWRHHQDLLLEEHLRTTPCSVRPAFEPPEAKNSTLTPISDARLFFLKEKHLWNNWKQQKYEKEDILPLNNEIERNFLTNNFLIRWCSDRIEIWDVSVIPMTPFVKTDPSVDIVGFLYSAVVSNNTLLVQQVGCVKVFYVDLLERKIELKYNVALDEGGNSAPLDQLLNVEDVNVVKGNIYVHINSNKSFLEIIDIKNGEVLKKEHCHVLGDEYKIIGIKSSATSENLIAVIETPGETRFYKYHIYIYSLSELTFMPVPVQKVNSNSLKYLAIHGDYVAVGKRTSATIYNYKTSASISYICSDERVWPQVFNDCFVFVVQREPNDGWFTMFSPTDQKCTIMCKHECLHEGSIGIINDKFVRVYGYGNLLSIWERSGKKLKRSDIPDIPNRYSRTINQAFTRGADQRMSGELALLFRVTNTLYHYW